MPDAEQARVEGMLAAAGQRLALPADSMGAYLAGGKRLRARLVMLTASLGADTTPGVVARRAAFVELVHAGGLCHDDVVDRSDRRRARPALGAMHGSRTAGLAGLALMLEAYRLIASEPAPVRRMVARAARRVATGQADEMTDLYRVDVEPAAYLDRCRAKTGALFELAADLGARAGGVDEAMRRAVVAFAAEVGLAFQLADDVRDFRGEAVIGREAGTDLREGVYTLPVLLTAAGRHPGGAELRILLGRLRASRGMAVGASIADLTRLLTANGAMRATMVCAHEAVARAFDALAGQPLAARRLEAYAHAVLDGACTTRQRYEVPSA